MYIGASTITSFLVAKWNFSDFKQMELKDLEHISTPNTLKKGENNSYHSQTEVNLINFPASFPDIFPKKFPHSDNNPLENNTDGKFANLT